MSKRHQASRRRTYGRRQHELHERMDRPVGGMDWLAEPDLAETGPRWSAEPSVRGAAGSWLQLQGIE